MKNYTCTFLDPNTFYIKETINMKARSVLDLLVDMNHKAKELGLIAGSYKQEVK